MKTLMERQAQLKKKNTRAKVRFPYGYCERHRRVHAGPEWIKSKQYCPDCREEAAAVRERER